MPCLDVLWPLCGRSQPWIGLGTLFLLGGLWPNWAIAQSVWLGGCPRELAAEAPAFNQVRREDVIVIGAVSSRPYSVIVPGDAPTILDQVRRCAPDAFVARSRLGPYVQAGQFVDRDRAEQLTQALRAQGLDARVEYFR